MTEERSSQDRAESLQSGADAGEGVEQPQDERDLLETADVGDEDDLLDDQADAAEDFLNGLLDILEIDGAAEAEIEEETIIVEVEGEDLALLIGRHGATLDALQELTRAAVQHQTAARCKMLLDVGGYRGRHRAALERRVATVAQRVLKSGKPATLEPMSAYDRRIVHQALAGMPGLATTSEGDEPRRRVVIRPA